MEKELIYLLVEVSIPDTGKITTFISKGDSTLRMELSTEVTLIIKYHIILLLQFNDNYYFY